MSCLSARWRADALGVTLDIWLSESSSTSVGLALSDPSHPSHPSVLAMYALRIGLLKRAWACRFSESPVPLSRSASEEIIVTRDAIRFPVCIRPALAVRRGSQTSQSLVLQARSTAGRDQLPIKSCAAQGPSMVQWFMFNVQDFAVTRFEFVRPTRAKNAIDPSCSRPRYRYAVLTATAAPTSVEGQSGNGQAQPVQRCRPGERG